MTERSDLTASAQGPGAPQRGIDRMTPLDRLQAAISILQHAVLAGDTPMSGKGTWGIDWMPGPALEAAIALLVDLQEHLEKVGHR
jgi:hypothetical protein